GNDVLPRHLAKVVEPLASAPDDGQVQFGIGGALVREGGMAGQTQSPSSHHAHAGQHLTAVQFLRPSTPLLTARKLFLIYGSRRRCTEHHSRYLLRFQHAENSRKIRIQSKTTSQKHGHGASQNSAFPGTRGNGITSRMFAIPVTNCTVRSSPSP